MYRVCPKQQLRCFISTYIIFMVIRSAPRSHFLLLKFSYTKSNSNELLKVICFMYLNGISSLIYSAIPQPLAVRSSLNGFEKPQLKVVTQGKYHLFLSTIP